MWSSQALCEAGTISSYVHLLIRSSQALCEAGAIWNVGQKRNVYETNGRSPGWDGKLCPRASRWLSWLRHSLPRQARWPGWYHRDPHVGKREQISTHCSLNSTCMAWYTCTHTPSTPPPPYMAWYTRTHTPTAPHTPTKKNLKQILKKGKKKNVVIFFFLKERKKQTNLALLWAFFHHSIEGYKKGSGQVPWVRSLTRR